MGRHHLGIELVLGHAGPGVFEDRLADRIGADLRALDQRDLLGALDLPDVVHQRGRIDEPGFREGLLEGAKLARRHRAVGKPQHAFEPGDADPRPSAATIAERGRHRLAPAALAGRADVGDPVLGRLPELDPPGLADDRNGRAGGRKDRRHSGAAAADRGQIAPIRLAGVPLAGVLGRDDAVEAGLRHRRAHGGVAAVAFGQAEPRQRYRFHRPIVLACWPFRQPIVSIATARAGARRGFADYREAVAPCAGSDRPTGIAVWTSLPPSTCHWRSMPPRRLAT